MEEGALLQRNQRDRNVVLVGFMATGKSTVGRRVASSLGYEFVDTDDVIQERHGPIPDLFATHGEDAFRAAERAVVADLAQRRRHVIATGGGVVLDDRNIAALEASGLVFCLAAEPDEIVRRVRSSRTNRPLLDGDDPAARVRELLAGRVDRYRRFAQVVTDHRSLDEIAAEIVAQVRDDGREPTADGA